MRVYKYREKERDTKRKREGKMEHEAERERERERGGRETELWSCVKVKVAVLGFLSIIVSMVSVDVKQP